MNRSMRNMSRNIQLECIGKVPHISHPVLSEVDLKQNKIKKNKLNYIVFCYYNNYTFYTKVKQPTQAN